MTIYSLEFKIYKYLEEMKGKKKLKEKDILKQISGDTGKPNDDVKKSLRAMVGIGMIMYSYGRGASSVEIPSEEYLKEKRIDRRLPDDYKVDIPYKNITIN